MKVGNIFDLLGLSLIAGAAVRILTSKATAANVTSSGSAWSSIVSSALGKA